LLDESGRRLLLSARTGPSVHHRGASPFRLGEGFIGWTAVHRVAAFSNRVSSDPRFVERRHQAWTPAAIMAVPLITARECIGVLSVVRRNRRPYRPVDLHLLQLVAELSVPYLEIARLKRISESDPLTLLHNRRFVQENLPEEIRRAGHHHAPLAAAMIDLDHFKLVNDHHGHEVGDEVLVEAAERIRRACRQSDLVARWGGEEFLIIFPQTSLRQAAIVAERIRRSIADSPFATSAGPVQVTASLGAATRQRGEEARTLIRRADQAMYQAKRGGRNRVFMAGAGSRTTC
jgi:diguanylate cyclase (GGDEF)-like protein